MNKRILWYESTKDEEVRSATIDSYLRLQVLMSESYEENITSFERMYNEGFHIPYEDYGPNGEEFKYSYDTYIRFRIADLISIINLRFESIKDRYCE